MIGGSASEADVSYQYWPLDYVGDIWNIDELDEKFEAILCTEVFEHIPRPIETLMEFSRLLKPCGLLLLTAPINCLRHMDPYYFYGGFIDRWHEYFLENSEFLMDSIDPVGYYYPWLGVEMAGVSVRHVVIAE